MTPKARTFAVRLATRTAVTWTLGVVAMALVTIFTARDAREDALDLRLRAHALAAYGIAYFDAEGHFHDELILKETQLLAAPIDIYVVTPEAIVFSSAEGRAPPVDLPALAREIVATGVERSLNGVDAAGIPYQLLSIPTYDDEDRRCAAIVTVSDARGVRRDWLGFSGYVLVMAAVFILLGIAVSARISHKMYVALDEPLRQREHFLAAAAHELRTPVASMLAIVESAAEGDEASDVALQRLGRTATQTAAMVERLLYWSRLGELQPVLEPLRLDLLVDTCVDDGDPTALSPTIVEGDAALLRVAVTNLLDNARRHGGGVRLVRVEGGEVEVLDRGEGLPDLADLGTPFVKGPASTGSGLGLALVQRIASAHGGALSLGPGGRVALRLKERGG